MLPAVNTAGGNIKTQNLIIGGDFTTNPWQGGTTFTALADGSYGPDQFTFANSGPGVWDILKTADAPTVAQAGFYTQHCCHVDVTTVDSSIAAGDYYSVTTPLEGLNVSALGYGQTGALATTLSFWVKSTKTGTFCVSFRNSAVNRSYVAEYTVSVTDTWEKKTVTIAGDITGTWLNTSGIGLRITWSIAMGSTFQTTANSWQAGNYNATSNQVNAMDSTSNNFKIALVQLEVGSNASAFAYKPFNEVFELCLRYYRKSFPVATAPAQNAGVAGAITVKNPIALGDPSEFVQFIPPMRISPTIVTYNPSAGNANWRDITAAADSTVSVDPASTISENGVLIATSGTVTTLGDILGIHYTASARM